MENNIYFMLIGILCVLGFSFVEKIALSSSPKKITKTIQFNKHDTSRLLTSLIGGFIGLIFNFFLLIYIVEAISPFEVFSISSWGIPLTLNFVISFLLIDLLHYLSHRLHHQLPLLWRFHRLHHSENKVDTLTALLHHPFEVISSLVINVIGYLIFDIPVIAIFYHSCAVLLNAPLTHIRLFLPERFDRFISVIFVTPNFHSAHHSLNFKESNSNFGIIFSFWDILFGTVAKISLSRLLEMKFGIELKQSPNSCSLREYLINPFIR
jgi:sterol desaturase/sphingolipid hydroxylase (fatty acid hydroxylase superfamily)